MGSAEGVRKGWTPERREAQRLRLLENPLKGGRPKGSKNKNPYPKTKAVLQKIEKTKQYLEIRRHTTGWHHTEETKLLQSNIKYQQLESGEFKPVANNNKYQQGNFNPAHPEKYMGDRSKIFYRSSWELRCMNHFDTDPNILSWASEEMSVPYFDPTTQRTRRYFPDFILKTKQADGSIVVVMVEIKPEKQTKPPVVTKRKRRSTLITEAKEYAVNQAKWEAARQFCAHKGWKFLVLTEKNLPVLHHK